MNRDTRRWLRPPVLIGEEAEREARQLFYILLTGLVVAPLFALVVLLVGNDSRIVVAGICLAAAIAVAALYLMLQAGRLRAVKIGLVALAYLAVTILVFNRGGISDPAVSVYFVAMLLAAIYLGRTATLTTGAVIAVTVTLGFWLEQVGVLTTWVVPTTVAMYLVIMLAITMQTVLLTAAVNRLVERSERIAHQADSLQMQNVRLAETQLSLKRRTDELEVVNRNLTDEIAQRRAAETALLQAQKLESLGLLAGGVAHDFNNLLTGVISQAELALLRLDQDHSAARHIGRALNSAQNAADLTRQLLTYAGRGKLEPEQLDLNVVVVKTRELIESGLKREVSIVYELGEGLPPVHIDRAQLQQILMNLVLNAADAVDQERGPDGFVPTVRVTTFTHEISAIQPDEYICAPTKPGMFVCLDVTDNGHGIERAALAKIFDPFFTTKATGHGLGLSAVLGIVRSHSGVLQVESRPQAGSRFVVMFPAVGLPPGIRRNIQLAGDDRAQTQDEALLAGCTVLIIDDADDVRATAADVVESAGGVALRAGSGVAGIELFHRHQAEVDVVLLDVRMPGLDGPATFQALRAISPTVKAVLTSGYVEESDVATLIEAGEALFLPKPYSIDSLVELLLAAINQPRETSNEPGG